MSMNSNESSNHRNSLVNSEIKLMKLDLILFNFHACSHIQYICYVLLPRHITEININGALIN